MCTINDSHIMYDSWNMECNRQFFCHLGPFLPFYPPPPPTNQPEKPKFWKWKKCMEMWRYHYFIQMYHKSWYATLFLIYNDRFNSYFYFWAIFCPFTPPPLPHHSSSTTQKIKIKKRKEKMPGDIIILHISNKNNDHMMYGSCSMVRNGQMDRQIDRKKTYWGGCPT